MDGANSEYVCKGEGAEFSLFLQKVEVLDIFAEGGILGIFAKGWGILGIFAKGENHRDCFRKGGALDIFVEMIDKDKRVKFPISF